mmetsp:Transcript_38259/g.75339  ORF Transcript_38259/g.75339 Transcript_38259/m.75339 type:complete len:931 (+) Transcript_38259:45-2837(+)
MGDIPALKGKPNTYFGQIGRRRASLYGRRIRKPSPDRSKHQQDGSSLSHETPFLCSDRVRFFEQFPVAPATQRPKSEGDGIDSYRRRTESRGSRASSSESQQRPTGSQTARVSSKNPQLNQRPAVPRPGFGAKTARHSENFGSYLEKALAAEKEIELKKMDMRMLQVKAHTNIHKQPVKLPAKIRTSRGNPTYVSIAEHAKLANEAINERSDRLYEVFKAKFKQETSAKRKEVVATYGRQRMALSKIISNYSVKFDEISHYFTEIRDAKTYIKALVRENQYFRALTIKAAKQFKTKIEDRDLEEKLIEIAKFPAPKQLNILEKQVRKKMDEVEDLQNEFEELDKEHAVFKAQVQEKIATLQEQEAQANDQAEATKARHKHKLQEDQSSITQLQLLIKKSQDKSRKYLLDLEAVDNVLEVLLAEKLAAIQKFENFKTELDEIVENGIANHEQMLKSFAQMTEPFYQSYTQLAALIQSYITTDTVVSDYLKCKQCSKVLTKPILLWPCGHTICEACLPEKGPEPDDQFRVDDCHECLRKTDPRVEREFDDDSYRNPHQEKVPMFRNKYYTAPNNRVAELLELYTNGQQVMNEMLEKLINASKPPEAIDKAKLFSTISTLGESLYKPRAEGDASGNPSNQDVYGALQSIVLAAQAAEEEEKRRLEEEEKKRAAEDSDGSVGSNFSEKMAEKLRKKKAAGKGDAEEEEDEWADMKGGNDSDADGEEENEGDSKRQKKRENEMEDEEEHSQDEVEEDEAPKSFTMEGGSGEKATGDEGEESGDDATAEETLPKDVGAEQTEETQGEMATQVSDSEGKSGEIVEKESAGAAETSSEEPVGSEAAETQQIQEEGKEEVGEEDEEEAGARGGEVAAGAAAEEQEEEKDRMEEEEEDDQGEEEDNFPAHEQQRGVVATAVMGEEEEDEEEEEEDDEFPM